LYTEGGESAGSIGKLTTLADIPDDDILIWYIRQAMAQKETVKKIVPTAKKVKAPTLLSSAIYIPDYLAELFDKTPEAGQYFDQFSPSQKKEYITWFEDAKTEATRQKRLTEGLEWISQGKTRHWKYK
jgi:uncharacterized protein YdeI (YjbR/CyaY-like superfamily)